jgi:hypothetical protein
MLSEHLRALQAETLKISTTTKVNLTGITLLTDEQLHITVKPPWRDKPGRKKRHTFKLRHHHPTLLRYSGLSIAFGITAPHEAPCLAENNHILVVDDEPAAFAPLMDSVADNPEHIPAEKPVSCTTGLSVVAAENRTTRQHQTSMAAESTTGLSAS